MGQPLRSFFTYLCVLLLSALWAALPAIPLHAQNTASLQEKNTAGDQGDPAPLFNDSDSISVSTPTLAFSSSVINTAENSGTVTLKVELVEAGGTPVDVDVVFLSASSSAKATDIGGFSTRTVSFSGTDVSGTVKTVVVNITDDADFEGSEEAVFQLQNNSAGKLIEPKTLTLIIEDDDSPDVVINELMPDPSVDINRDGTADSGDQFVEIVNNENFDVDISSWTLSDTRKLLYSFPSGTVLPAKRALVLFGGDSASGNFGGAAVFNSKGLKLDDGGGTVTLKNANGNKVDQLSYSSVNNNESLSRDPDRSGKLVNHSDAADAIGKFSPGTKADGTSFGARYAMSIRGREGWRMIAAPTQSTSFKDLFGRFKMQGISGSDQPSGSATIYSWQEGAGGEFSSPSAMADMLSPGKGYIVYFSADAVSYSPGMQGGFPKIISTDKPENDSPVQVSLSSTDYDSSRTISGNEGWNLLGNPFGVDIGVDNILSVIREALQARSPKYEVNNNVYVWNSSTESFQSLQEGQNKTIAPFKAFWVRIDTVEYASGFTITPNFNRSTIAANSGSDFFKKALETKYAFTLKLSDDASSFDSFYLGFSDRGKVGYNHEDAYKLFSLKPDAINLYALSGRRKLLKDILPDRLNQIVEIPLSFSAPGRDALTFSWSGLNSLPQYWKISLKDRHTGSEINLKTDSDYTFSIFRREKANSFPPGKQKPLYKTTPVKSGEARFVLRINPGLADKVVEKEEPSSVQLNPNYPNPFNPTTVISYELTQRTQVKLTIWNIVGQKVATLVDGSVEAGLHKEVWNASTMPSGIYIAQLEVAGKVFIRKMTLIK